MHNYLPKIEDYDALIFFQWNVNESTVFPEVRRPEQIYILHYLESPQRSVPHQKINPYSYRFNMTMSYRYSFCALDTSNHQRLSLVD